MPIKSTAKALIVPPPVKGLNKRDPVSNKERGYAEELLNFFPDSGKVRIRKGAEIFVESLGAVSEQWFDLATYNSPAGSSFLIGFTSGEVYDLTSGTPVDITGTTNIFTNETYTINYAGYIFMKANSASNDVYHWAGTGNVTAAAFTGPSGDDKNLWKMCVYKGRIYFLERSASTIWYPATVGAITGALNSFNFSNEFSKGGALFHIDSYSGNAYSTQANFVAISSEGEILLYQGDSPDSSTWGLVGKFDGPKPVGTRSFFKWGSEILIISAEGVIPISEVLNVPNAKQRSYLTDAIHPLFRDYVDYVINNGLVNFQSRMLGFYYPEGPFIGISIPIIESNDNSRLLVMNITSGAWSEFEYEGRTFAPPYFAVSDRKLYAAKRRVTGEPCVSMYETGDVDEALSGSGNYSRTIEMKTAFDFLDNPYSIKQFTAVLPYWTPTAGDLSITMDANVDFEDLTPTNTESFTDTILNKSVTMGLNGIGTCISLHLEQTVDEAGLEIEAFKIFWNEGDLK